MINFLVRILVLTLDIFFPIWQSFAIMVDQMVVQIAQTSKFSPSKKQPILFISQLHHGMSIALLHYRMKHTEIQAPINADHLMGPTQLC